MLSSFLKTSVATFATFAAIGSAQASTLVHEVGGEIGAIVHTEHAFVAKSRTAVTQELMQLRAKMPSWNQQLMGAPTEARAVAPRSREAVAQEARAAVSKGQIVMGEAS